MTASKYKIWAVGQPLGDGVSGAIHVGMAAVAKKANVNEPNIVINELLCNLLARALFLPCPPGALLDHNGDSFFCSLNFNLAGQSLPPSPIPLIASKLPDICWGVILFDVLVMNPDRHSRNLSFDRTTNRVQIFDHSRAFLPNKADVDTMIRENAGRLGFTRHCLKNEIANFDGFEYWVQRIKLLPDYIIEEAVEEICSAGFARDKKAVTIDFIKSRRDTVDSLVQSNISEFPKLPRPEVTLASIPSGVPAAGAVVSNPAVAQPGQAE